MTDETLEAIERLHEMVSDTDPEVRGMVAVALASVDSPYVYEDLCILLGDSDLRVACAAAHSLGNLSDLDAVPSLIEALKAEKNELTCAVLLALGHLRDPRAFNAVVVELFNPDDKVRRDAAGIIGCLGDKRAIEPLIALLDDSFLWVRANAVLSLGFLADVRAVVPLLDLLRVEEDETVRGNAIAALGACDPQQTPLIIATLLNGWEKEKVRVSASITLATLASTGKLTDEDGARKAILEVLGDTTASDETRAASAWALGRMPSHPDIVAALTDATEDDYNWVVFYALESLALQGDAEVLRFLKTYRQRHAADEELLLHIDDAIHQIEDTDDAEEVPPSQ